MPGVIAFAAAHWRAIGALVIALLLYGYIETLRLERDHAYKVEAQAKADLLLFKTEVAALGKKAESDKNAKEAADQLKKEKADAENSAALAVLAGDIKRLRDERDSRASTIPERPAGSKCPDGQACFDRAELERALRDYRSEVRRLVDEGAAVTIDLNTAKRWAQGF